MSLKSEHLQFFDQLYNEFHGVVIAKSITGKYLYANKNALLYMKKNDLDEIINKEDKDFNWPYYIADILNHTSNISRCDYSGTRLIPPLKIFFQRTPYIIGGNLIAKVHTISFVSTDFYQYSVNEDGSITIKGQNEDITLSKLEVDVAKYMVFQYSPEETAEKIHKSPSSVKKYRPIIYQKLNCTKKDETIKKMVKIGLLHYFLEA